MTIRWCIRPLVVEILSKSTAKFDKATSVGGIKFEDYASHGVREYWIIDPVRQSVSQYRLDEPTMAFAEAAILFINDTLSSLTVSGFQIPVQAIFDKEAINDLQMLMT